VGWKLADGMLGAGVEEGARRGVVRERERGEKIEECTGLFCIFLTLLKLRGVMSFGCPNESL
jgi:hypothetical protein